MSLDATHVGSGKVRELYALDDGTLALAASDRISTFDVVLPTPIPDKGRVLTGLSAFWFSRTHEIVPNHLLRLGEDGRTMVCRRLEMLPIECVVRGYLAGSGWKDYRDDGSGVRTHASPGLEEASRLPEPIFTPATKAVEGHDENIDEERAAALCGDGAYRAAKEASLALYRFASKHAEASRDHPRRHEVRARRRARRIGRTRRRGSDTRLVALLAGVELRSRAPAAVVRQAVRPRLVRANRMGQDRARAGAAGRRRRRDASAVRRGVRAAHGAPVRRSTSPTRRWSCEGDGGGASEGRHPRPAGRCSATLAAKARVSTSPACGSVASSTSSSPRTTAKRRRAQVQRMCSELLANPLIESFEIRIEDE